MNIFDKLEQELNNQIHSLQAKQQELIEKKKNLVAKREKIQNFLSSAQEVKTIIESEPELIKSVQKELGKIFAFHNNQQPKLPIKKDNSSTPNLESPSENTSSGSSVGNTANTQENDDEESIKIFNFVDAQGKNVKS